MAVSLLKPPRYETVDEVQRLKFYNGYMQRPFPTETGGRSGVTVM
jgi:hypothetical protein